MDVLTRTFSANGTSNPPEAKSAGQPVGTMDASNRRFPLSASLGGGTFIVVYQAKYQRPEWGAEKDVVAARLFNAAGHAVADEFVVSNTSDAQSTQDFYPQVVALGPSEDATDGPRGFAVVWVRYNPASPATRNIFARFYSNDAVPLAGEMRVNTLTSLSNFDFAVTALPSSVLVVWVGTIACVQSALFSQSLSHQGALLGTESILSDIASLPLVASPAIATFPSTGSFMISWVNQSPQNPYQATLSAQLFDKNGARYKDPFLIATDIGFYGSSFIAPSPSKGFVILWEYAEKQQTAFDVYGRRFDENAVPLGSSFRLNQVSTNSQISPKGVFLSPNLFAAVWASEAQDEDGSYGVVGKVWSFC
jgi:hypothetical protein